MHNYDKVRAKNNEISDTPTDNAEKCMKKLIFTYLAISLFISILGTAVPAQSKKDKTKAKPPVIAASSSLKDEEIVFGLKDALSNGVSRAGAELSRQGGFYDDPRVKLSMPPELQALEKKLRSLKYDDLVDDFVVSMNRAAEQSVVETSFPLNDAIRQMTVQEPKKLLAGPKDAATQYFRRTSEKVLLAKVTPLAQTANSEAGVLEQFKILMQKGGGLNTPAGQKPFSIDEYVAQKVLDGMLLITADEEKRIREDPAARTTAILKKVFGSNIK